MHSSQYAEALSTIASTDIRVDLRTLEGRGRSDIAVRGRSISGRRAWTTISKYTPCTIITPRLRQLPRCMSLNSHSFNQCVFFLDRIAKSATQRAPEAAAEFRAIVLGTGGFLSTGTAEEMAKWKRAIGAVEYERTISGLDLDLLK